MMVTLASFFVSTPARLWSPVSKLAVTKIRHTRLWRMLWLPVIGVPMATWMLLALCFGTLIVTERTIGTVSKSLIFAGWSVSIGCFAATAMLLLWVGGVIPEMHWASESPEKVPPPPQHPIPGSSSKEGVADYDYPSQNNTIGNCVKWCFII